jgi:predicted transcriptional regulator
MRGGPSAHRSLVDPGFGVDRLSPHTPVYSGLGTEAVAWWAGRERGGVRVRVFGELETVVMARLWALGGHGTVREVLEQIQREREIAYTTVLSTMENLHRKGHLTREREGKAYRYRTALSHAEHTAALMREALRSGAGDTETVLTHFVGDMDEDELARLREVIGRRRQGTDKTGGWRGVRGEGASG